MSYSQSPPIVEREWLTEGISVDGPARDVDARSHQRVGKRPMKPAIHSGRPSSLHEQVASDRPSIGRRIFRSLTRFSLAVLIGVGATLGWQSYGDAAREMIIARAPTLAWWLPVSTAKSPVVATTSPDVVRHLEPLTSNLDVVRRSVEQLAAKQEQMAESIAALQAVGEDIRQRMSFTPPPTAPAQQVAPIPRPKSPQPRSQSSAVQSTSGLRPPPPAGPVSPSR
jgi:hypothetical protein